MDDSQVAVLPPELRAQAQALRQEMEARNRRVLQDRLYSTGTWMLLGVRMCVWTR